MNSNSRIYLLITALLVLVIIVLIMSSREERKEEEDEENKKEDEKEKDKQEFTTTTYTSTPDNQYQSITNVGGLNYGMGALSQDTSYTKPSLSLYPSYPDINPYNYPYRGPLPQFSYPAGTGVSPIVPSFVADAIEQPHISYSALPNTPYGQYSKPMLTSIVNPKDFITGNWVKSGIGYSTDPNNPKILDVYQLTLDPAREIYEYKFVDRDGFEIPNYNIRKLEDNDTFTLPMFSNTFKFEEDKYDYIYI